MKRENIKLKMSNIKKLSAHLKIRPLMLEFVMRLLGKNVKSKRIFF